jgi:hypothetical protein
MLKFKQHTDEQWDLDEGIRQWFTKAKSVISSAFKSAMNRIRKLKAGQSVNIPLSLPKNISEEKQLGKKGGELAEVAMIRELYRLLNQKNVEVYYWEQGKKLSRAKFKNDIFDKNLEDYRKQEGKNKRKRENDWIKHGKAGAQHVFTYLEELPGPWSMYRIKLEHLGEALTGISKGDINVIVEVKKTDEVLDYIGHLSVKTTLENSPFETPNNGLQTGWETFVLQLLTGKTSNVLKKDLMTETKVESLIRQAQKKLEGQSEYLENAIAEAERVKGNKNTPAQRRDVARKIKKYRATVSEAKELVEEANENYKKTLEYTLDQLGESIGIETSLSKYMKDIVKTFKEYGSAPGRANARDPAKRKDEKITLKNKEAIKEYMLIIKKALQRHMKSPAKKEEMIRGIMKLGGIESGLDYVALGVNPDDQDASWAISTLGSNEYKKLEKIIRGTLGASVIETSNGEGLRFVVTKNKKEILSFGIGKSVNNSRIYLPTFKGPDNERLSLLSKYAQGYEE